MGLFEEQPWLMVPFILVVVAAVAFLMPRTMRMGAGVLLVVLGLAFVMHAARGEWRPDLVVYAAGVLLVGVHGDARASGGTTAPVG
jgi:predicted Na+-dependent transporter